MKKMNNYANTVSAHNSSMFIVLQVDTHFYLKAFTSFQRYYWGKKETGIKIRQVFD